MALEEGRPNASTAACRLLQELVSNWSEAMATVKSRDGQDAIRNSQKEASTLLRQFAQQRPEDDQAQLTLVTFVRVSAGGVAALDHIAAMRAPSPSLVGEYFNILIDRLLRAPSADLLKRAFLEPLPFPAQISLDMLRFRFQRAVIVEALVWNRRFDDAFGDAALHSALDNFPEQDPAAELSTIFSLLSLLPPNEQARALMSLMACPAIWRSPAAEATRRRLLDAAMKLVPRVSDAGVMTSLMARLIDYAPQSIIYWEDPAWPRRLHEMACALSPRIAPAQRHYFNGITAFPLPDLDKVAEEFQQATAVEPTASRFTSYLDPRQVHLGASDRLLNSDSFECDALDVSQGENDFTLVTSADERYFRRYAVSYAKRLQEVGYRKPLHFHIIGRRAALAKEIQQVRDILPESRVTLSSESVLADRSFYYASARFLRMRELLRRFSSDILVTDIDVSWHARPDQWAAALGDADVGLRIFDRVRHYTVHNTQEVILRFPRTKLWECTSASSIFVRCNDAGTRFADLLANVTDRHLRPFLEKPGTHWFIDQNILSAVYAHVIRHDPAILIGNLDSVGTPYGPYGMLRDERLQHSYGNHWIAKAEPFPSA